MEETTEQLIAEVNPNKTKAPSSTQKTERNFSETAVLDAPLKDQPVLSDKKLDKPDTPVVSFEFWDRIATEAKSPKIKFFATCIGKGVFIKNNPLFMQAVTVNIENLKKVLDEFEPDPKQEERDAVPVPETFDWDKEATQSLHEAIDILFKTGLVPRDTLVDASKFIGPGNIRIMQGANYGKHNVDEYIELLVSTGRRSVPLPIPDSKALRNQYISLDVGTEIVKDFASDFLSVAKEANIDLSQNDILHLAMIRVMAHEYGHAIDSALEARGVNTEEKARLFNKEYEFLPLQEQLETHSEHFARGIEGIVGKEYLRKIGYKDDVIDKLFAAKLDKDLQTSSLEESLLFLKSMQEHGVDLEDLFEFEKYLSMSVAENLIRGVSPKMPNFAIVMKYYAKPYQADQIRYLLQI